MGPPAAQEKKNEPQTRKPSRDDRTRIVKPDVRAVKAAPKATPATSRRNDALRPMVDYESTIEDDAENDADAAKEVRETACNTMQEVERDAKQNLNAIQQTRSRSGAPAGNRRQSRRRRGEPSKVQKAMEEAEPQDKWEVASIDQWVEKKAADKGNTLEDPAKEPRTRTPVSGEKDKDDLELAITELEEPSHQEEEREKSGPTKDKKMGKVTEAPSRSLETTKASGAPIPKLRNVLGSTPARLNGRMVDTTAGRSSMHRIGYAFVEAGREFTGQGSSKGGATGKRPEPFNHDPKPIQVEASSQHISPYLDLVDPCMSFLGAVIKRNASEADQRIIALGHRIDLVRQQILEPNMQSTTKRRQLLADAELARRLQEEEDRISGFPLDTSILERSTGDRERRSSGGSILKNADENGERGVSRTKGKGKKHESDEEYSADEDRGRKKWRGAASTLTKTAPRKKTEKSSMKALDKAMETYSDSELTTPPESDSD